MIEEFKYKGQWFLRENPENKISGLLKFDTKSDSIIELAPSSGAFFISSFP